MTADVSVAPVADPADDLAARLDDPQVRASLTRILDNADLLAIMVTALDGLLRRADVIGDSLTSGVADIRTVASANGGTMGDTVTRLSGALAAGLPALEKIMNSPLAQPQTADVLLGVGGALVEGNRAAAADTRGPKGVFGLLKAAKDPDVARGLGFLLQVARALGRNIATQQ